MRIINIINLVLVALSSLAFGSAMIIAKRGLSEEPLRLMPKELSFPKSPFPHHETHFDQGPLSLKWAPPKPMLPHLHNEIRYLGKNHRPDVPEGKSRFTLSIGKNKDPLSVEGGEKLYLKYLSDLKTGTYVFSPENRETPLWLEARATVDGDTDCLEIQAFLCDEDHEIITSPSSHHFFTLKMEERPSAPSLWELNGIRVDGSLMIRQGARLTGRDLFLEMHGGDQFKDSSGREKLDFLSGDHPYYCFIKEGDFLIWKDKKWQRPQYEERTEGYPLLVVKKLDEKTLSFELWDVEGKNKMLLSLPRSKNYEPPLDLHQEFKLVGAKTWIECVVECRGKRIVMKEGDWMVLTPEGWHKISSEKEVDDYVEQKLFGPLFILDKITKKNNRTALIGHLFNALRTTVTDIELANQENILKPEFE